MPWPTPDERRRQLREGVALFLDQVLRKFPPEKVVLFGSLVAGDVQSWSDADIAIIRRTDKPYFDRIEELVDACDFPVAIDCLVYTPEEYDYECRNNPFVREEIARKGKVIYDVSQGPLAF